MLIYDLPKILGAVSGLIAQVHAYKPPQNTELMTSLT